MTRTVAAAALFLLAALPAAYRALDPRGPGGAAVAEYALQDFRDAVYYPVRALLDGANPYDTPRYMAAYPVGQPFPLYSPATIALHLPFGLLPYGAARTAYAAYTILLSPAIAALALVLCGLRPSAPAALALGAALLVTRPGQMNLFIGQSTATVVLAVYAALALRARRPGLAALALAVTTAKPTFAVPVMALLVARGAWRPVVVGSALGATLAAGPAAMLVASCGGLGPFLASLGESQASFAAHPAVDPATSLYRIDLAGVLGRLAGTPLGVLDAAVTVAVLAAVAAALRGLVRTRDPRAEVDADGLVCAATLVAVYHQLYGAVLLLFPVLALATGRTRVDGWRRTLLLALLAVPALNYAASRTALGRLQPGDPLWLAVTSAAGVAIATALVVWACAPRPRAGPTAGRLEARAA